MDLHYRQAHSYVVGEGDKEAIDADLAELLVGDECVHQRPREDHQDEF